MNNLTTRKTKRSIAAATLLTCTLASAVVVPTASFANTLQTDSPNAVALSEREKEKATNREGVGFGIGAVVGGILGGPIGIIAGGAAGNFIAVHINKNREIEQLNTALVNNNAKTARQINSIERSFSHKLQLSEQAHQQELLSLEQSYQSQNQIKAQELLMSLQFTSGSSEIAPHYQEQVAVLAQLLNADASLSVNLSGYTDLAGDEEKNQALSLKRVQSVKHLLMAQGVDEAKINTFAFGEAQAVASNNNSEANLYDRRVVLQIKPQASVTAQR